MSAETISVTFVLPDGSKKEVNAPLGISMLEVAHSNNIFELEGACEGSLSCSTCHVYVEKYFEKIQEPKPEEEDMLDLAFEVKMNSRLGCQIITASDLDGIILIIPADNRNFAG